MSGKGDLYGMLTAVKEMAMKQETLKLKSRHESIY